MSMVPAVIKSAPLRSQTLLSDIRLKTNENDSEAFLKVARVSTFTCK